MLAYINDCQYSAKAARIFDNLARKYAGARFAFAKINVNAHEAVAQKLNQKGFPFIQLQLAHQLLVYYDEVEEEALEAAVRRVFIDTKTPIRIADPAELESLEKQHKIALILITTDEELKQKFAGFLTAHASYFDIPLYEAGFHMLDYTEDVLHIHRGFDDGPKSVTLGDGMTVDILRSFLLMFQKPVCPQFEDKSAAKALRHHTPVLLLQVPRITAQAVRTVTNVMAGHINDNLACFVVLPDSPRGD